MYSSLWDELCQWISLSYNCIQWSFMCAELRLLRDRERRVSSPEVANWSSSTCIWVLTVSIVSLVSQFFTTSHLIRWDVWYNVTSVWSRPYNFQPPTPTLSATIHTVVTARQTDKQTNDGIVPMEPIVLVLLAYTLRNRNYTYVYKVIKENENKTLSYKLWKLVSSSII